MIERTRPVCKGVDEKGELVWTVIPMPRWQMEMFRVTVNWLSEFIDRWIDLKFYEHDGDEFLPDTQRDYYVVASKKELDRLRRFYPKKKTRKHV